MTIYLQKAIPKDYPKNIINLGPTSPAPKGYKLYMGKKGGRYAIKTEKKQNDLPLERVIDLKKITSLEGITPNNINTLKNKVRNNPQIKNYLQKVYNTLGKREQGKGAKIRLSSLQLLAALEVGKFAFMSAGNNSINKPKEHQNKDKIYFKQKHNEMNKDLNKLGYLHNDCIGNYGGLERSIMVMIHDADKENKDLYTLGKKYHQHSIVYSDNTDLGKHTNTLEKVYTDGKESISSKDYKIVSDEEALNPNQCYTRITLKSGKKVKVLLNIPQDNKQETFWNN